jgi:F0F1-type ATP synthase membrane subunit c/vacuolar-type H+-ATPase subunit K
MVAVAVVALGALTVGVALPVTARGATGRSFHAIARPPALRRMAVCIEVMAVAAAILALFSFAS